MSTGVDVEKEYSKTEVIDKLRRLADALEQDKTFEIQIAGERIYVPPYAQIEFEYERDDEGNEEIEIELKWNKS
jgi:amphi-Trp domain-containing protein